MDPTVRLLKAWSEQRSLKEYLFKDFRSVTIFLCLPLHWKLFKSSFLRPFRKQIVVNYYKLEEVFWLTWQYCQTASSVITHSSGCWNGVRDRTENYFKLIFFNNGFNRLNPKTGPFPPKVRFLTKLSPIH